MNAKVKRIAIAVLQIAAIGCGFLIYTIACDRYYFGTKQPEGIRSVSDYFRRFGEPAGIRAVERDGQSYYQFYGKFDPPWWCLTVPSSPPAHIFDGAGRFSSGA